MIHRDPDHQERRHRPISAGLPHRSTSWISSPVTKFGEAISGPIRVVDRRRNGKRIHVVGYRRVSPIGVDTARRASRGGCVLIRAPLLLVLSTVIGRSSRPTEWWSQFARTPRNGLPRAPATPQLGPVTTPAGTGGRRRTHVRAPPGRSHGRSHRTRARVRRASTSQCRLLAGCFRPTPRSARAMHSIASLPRDPCRREAPLAQSPRSVHDRLRCRRHQLDAARANPCKSAPRHPAANEFCRPIIRDARSPGTE